MPPGRGGVAGRNSLLTNDAAAALGKSCVAAILDRKPLHGCACA
jgi:hypothetical protein